MSERLACTPALGYQEHTRIQEREHQAATSPNTAPHAAAKAQEADRVIKSSEAANVIREHDIVDKHSTVWMIDLPLCVQRPLCDS